MKKFAIKGLIVLAVVVALCMFLSGTIYTITMPKVKLLQAKQGKLEQTVSLSGVLTFVKPEEVVISEAALANATVTNVYVNPGTLVSAGDPLYDMTMTGFDEAMAANREAYQSAQSQLLELEAKNRSLKIKRTDESWLEAYFALSDAQKTSAAARVTLNALLTSEKLTLVGTEAPEGASEALIAAVQAKNDADAAEKAAQSAYDALSRFSVDETVFTYYSQKRDYEAKIKEAEEKMVALEVAQDSVATVKAPHTGYIAEMLLKVGDSYDGKSVAYKILPEEQMPVLRADTDEIKQTIAAGSAVVIAGRRGDVESEVTETGFTTESKRYADVALTNSMIKDLGGGYALSVTPANMKLTFRAQVSTTLLPAAAVRGSGDDRYVYTVSDNYAAIGASTKKIAKTKVTVLAEVGAMVSVEEDLSYSTIAYMEDRAISEGSSVMEYVN